SVWKPCSLSGRNLHGRGQRSRRGYAQGRARQRPHRRPKKRDRYRPIFREQRGRSSMGTFTPPLHDRARSASGISAGNARSRCCARQFNAFDQEFAKSKSARISAEIRRGKAAAWTFPGLRPPTAKSPNMKRLALILLIGGTALPSAFAWQNSRNSSLLARVTVYWARGGHGADRYTRQHRSATGMKLHVGHCAVDPKKIPYGSRVVLPDGTTLSAVDTGSAVRNRKAARRAGRNPNERNAVVIDKFFETKQQALAWANSNPPFVNVKVIPPNM